MIGSFVDRVRTESAYPAFRGFVGVLTWISYIIAACLALVGLFGGAGSGNLVGMALFLIGAMLWALLTNVAREIALMLADIADATLLVASDRPLPAPRASHAPRPADQQR